MNRRITLWVLAGIAVAACWAAAGFLAPLDYNPGRSTVAAITAPASWFGRTEPLSLVWFLFLNGGIYGIAGLSVESLRRLVRFSA